MSQAQTLVDDYFRFLRDRTVLRSINEWVEITTPFLDRHNDYIQIYLKSSDMGYVISDGGDTLTDLEQSGCSLDSPKRKSILKLVLNGYGVSEAHGSLEVHATNDNFAVKKHNLIQAILSISDMFFLASPTVEAVFFEDVQTWLDLNDIRYSPRIKFAGKSGFDHVFDFVIPKSKFAPERIGRAINNPTKDSTMGFLLAWLDTRDSRPENAEPFAFLYDNDRQLAGNITDALTNYGITPVLWSRREDFLPKLAA